MNQVIISLGGNLPTTQESFINSVELIEQKIGPIIKKSSIYQSSPWGFTRETNPFLNQILIIKTICTPLLLLNITQQIELELGRKQKTKKEYEDRVIDIDILFINNDIISEKHLKVPHPLIHKRNFILKPLAEIAPNLIHPIFKKTIYELLLLCEDTGSVN